jgi:predicted N-acetyltransferase YhbS
MMVSGLPKPWWNNADVHDPRTADVAELTRWYEVHGVPWGMRVPAGAAWGHGRLLFRNRLMALEPSAFLPAPPAAGVTMRPATEEDIAVVAAIDAEAFGGDPTPEWLAPLVRSGEALVAIAFLDGRPVGTGYVLQSDGWAGRSALLAGVAVVPGARRRGIAGVMSSCLLENALERGARMSVLNPDTDDAARVYARLGYVELPGFDIYLAG